MTGRRTLVVVGHGMVGHKLVQALLERGAGAVWEIVVFGEEARPAYDRMHLSALFDGATADDLSLAGEEAGDPAVEVCSGDRVVAIDRSARTVTTARGRVQAYDVAVLAAGSYPFVPQVPGRDLPGCFVYRTVADVEAIRSWAKPGIGKARRGVVVAAGSSVWRRPTPCGGVAWTPRWWSSLRA